MITLKVRGLKNFKLDKKQYYPQVAPPPPSALTTWPNRLRNKAP